MACPFGLCARKLVISSGWIAERPGSLLRNWANNFSMKLESSSTMDSITERRDEALFA